jgi:hypothetical protein
MKTLLLKNLSPCALLIAASFLSPAAFAAAKKKEATPAATAAESKTEKVNLNTADEKTIAGVKGVGEKLAAELVKNRPYKTWDDVSKVKGIGSGKKLDSFKMVLKLSEGVPAAAAPAEKSAKESKTAMTEKAAAVAPTAAAAPAAVAGGAAAGAAKAKSADVSSSVTPQSPPVKGMVWVNTSTKVFHREGDEWYGKTKRGKFMTEDEAIKAGYHESKEKSQKQ